MNTLLERQCFNFSNFSFLNYTSLLQVFLLTTLFLKCSSGFAQSVEPMIFELEPIGGASTETLRIDNPGSGPITLEIVPLKITFDEYGNESHEAAEDDFLIYPPQTIVQAGSTQVVKVKYIGDPEIQNSKAYRISINQLPVDLKTDSSGVSILTKFLTLVNVSPRDSRPDMRITEIVPQENDRWLVTIRNAGDRYGILSNSNWELESSVDASVKKTINADELSTHLIQTLVLPKSTLRLSVPAVDGFDPSSTNIVIKQES